MDAREGCNWIQPTKLYEVMHLFYMHKDPPLTASVANPSLVKKKIGKKLPKL